jgi:hypothetical protein
MLMIHRIHTWVGRSGWEPLDERGGSRNSDEGFYIAGGAVLAGTILAGVGAFVADRLGLLQ